MAATTQRAAGGRQEVEFRRVRMADLRQLPMVETHISQVFLGEYEVFKLKKSVALGFLDFSTLAKRRAAVLCEVALNSRLAPAVYRGVARVVDDNDELLDWAVCMWRLDETWRADAMLEAGELRPAHLDHVARALVRFHAAARCDDETGRFGEVALIERNVSENFDQTEGWLAEVLTPSEQREIEAWQVNFLADHGGEFHRRVQEGRVRDGHGDLRLEHLYFCPDVAGPSDACAAEDDRPTGLQIIDCIEFNERFRYADVCADLAFLAMDLAWNGKPLLAERLLSAYAALSNDYELYSLVDFYESYRAFVRGKIALFVAHDEGVDLAARQRSRQDARRFFRLALSSERRSLQRPMVVAVGGLIATGKSTVARRIALELGGPVISADRTRKSLEGVDANTSLAAAPFTGAYGPKRTRATYEELMRRARLVLRSGRPVVLDASFRTAELRQLAQALATAEGVEFRFLECQAPREVLMQRLHDREGERLETDARADLLSAFEQRWQPPRELRAEERLLVDTSGPYEALDLVVVRVLSLLRAAPSELV